MLNAENDTWKCYFCLVCKLWTTNSLMWSVFKIITTNARSCGKIDCQKTKLSPSEGTLRLLAQGLGILYIPLLQKELNYHWFITLKWRYLAILGSSNNCEQYEVPHFRSRLSITDNAVNVDLLRYVLCMISWDNVTLTFLT